MTALYLKIGYLNLIWKGKIELIVDNATGHSHLNDSLQVLNLFFLNPNVTTNLQPLDQGVIQNFKLHYKEFLLEKIIECLYNNSKIVIGMSQVVKWCKLLGKWWNPV
jgi:hypothetical protein